MLLLLLLLVLQGGDGGLMILRLLSLSLGVLTLDLLLLGVNDVHHASSMGFLRSTHHVYVVVIVAKEQL